VWRTGLAASATHGRQEPINVPLNRPSRVEFDQAGSSPRTCSGVCRAAKTTPAHSAETWMPEQGRHDGHGKLRSNSVQPSGKIVRISAPLREPPLSFSWAGTTAAQLCSRAGRGSEFNPTRLWRRYQLRRVHLLAPLFHIVENAKPRAGCFAGTAGC